MKTIHKYIAREYLKILGYAMLTFISIYLVVDFFERFDMFIRHGAETPVIIRYFLYKIPLVVYQMTPVAVLLATLMTIGIFSRNNEITAMKSCGISIYMTALPLLLASLVITALTFIGGEYVAPYTNMKVADIKNDVRKNEPKYFLKHDRIWYTGKGIIYNIDYFDTKTNELHGITIFSFDDDFNLTKRVDARDASFNDGSWTLKDVEERNFSLIDGTTEMTSLKESQEKRVPLPETPETFKEVRKKTEEMSFGDLKTFIAKLRNEGYDPTEYEVDLHAKLSIPFISVIMTIIGIPFALKSERSGSIAVGIGMSIAIGFCYWITLSFALSLGHAGVLPPVVSAWISLVIFLLIGGYMFSTIRQ